MIYVSVKKQTNYPVSSPKIKKALQNFLEKEGIVSDADVSVSIVGEKKMLELSSKYLKERKTLHNVLSFPYIDNDVDFRYPPDNLIHLGEIVLCYPKIIDEAKSEGKLIDQKAIELAEHGAMHLLGKHHK